MTLDSRTVEQKVRTLCDALELFCTDVEQLLDVYGLEEFVREKAMPKKLAKVDLSGDMTALLTKWKQVHDQLETLKSEEAQLRIKLVTDNFKGDKLEGVESIDIGWGYRLKATKNLNYSATNESHQTEQLLAAVAAVDPGMAQGLIKWKPDVSTKVCRELITLAEQHPTIKAAMMAAITIKPGMPELELVPPKPAYDVSEVTGVIVENVPLTGTVTTDGSTFKEGF